MKRAMFLFSLSVLFGCGAHYGGCELPPSSSSYADWAYRRDVYGRVETFHDAALEPNSSFAVDVDTASYSLARKLVSLGRRPSAANVRLEEFVNAFPYEYAPAAESETLSLSGEVSSAPWMPARRLLRIGIRTPSKSAATARRNFVFLVDVSGSMREPTKLPLVKQSLRLLIDTLGPEDRVALVTYADGSRVVLPPTSGSSKALLLDTVDELEASGGTNGGAGIRQAYDLAQESFSESGVNRVLLCTDGDFNLGVTSETALVELIRDRARSGIDLTVLGFGASGDDYRMEYLADNGNGNYGYVDTVDEARRLLVTEAASTFETAARDVKVQVTFNPSAVRRYRLLGYDDRRLSDAEFEDGRTDAGEMGYGASVTALYEIETTDSADKKLVDLTVKYAAASEPGRPQERRLEVRDEGRRLTEASTDQRFSGAVAWFALILRGDAYTYGQRGEDVVELAKRAMGADPFGQRARFVKLVSDFNSLY